MSPDASQERAAVVAEALAWLKTPYHLNACVKGVGVDCGTFLIAVFTNAGLIDGADLGTFRDDFHLHRGEEVYLQWLQKYCDPLPWSAEVFPGDIIMYQYGRIQSHGAIVTDWPRMIHAYRGVGVIKGNAANEILKERQRGIWRFRRWAE